jgi:hypothetical protein
MKRLACIALAVCGWSWAADAEAGERLEEDGTPLVETGSVRRFALVIGANDGGTQRVKLRYAGTDAKTIAKVLGDLGGVKKSDRMVLEDPTQDVLLWEIGTIAERVRRAKAGGDNVQFIFYYSGHSDEEGILLGGVRMEYRDLRKAIDKVPADVRVAILDSCASGAFTRSKGGTKRAPFLVGQQTDVKGHAYLTSSSEDEAAQESDRVGGSFFTHFLTTGLRGAADEDGDRMVTLSEAFQFAFDETLARTEATRGGAQHAAYDINLSGTGDLVLTDLRRTTARLELTNDIGGRVSVRRVGGELVAELYKPPGSGSVLLALEPGRYQITVDDGEKLYRGEEVVGRERAVLDASDLKEISRESVVERGDPRTQPEGPKKPPPPEYLDVAVDFGLMPPLSINGTKRRKHPGKKIRNAFSLGFLWSRTDRIEGAAIALGPTFASDGVHGAQLSLFATVAKGKVEGAQLSNGVNIADELQGGQVGTIFNHANYARGVQMSLVNHAHAIRGGQLGVVNVAGKVKGAQLGLFSFARSADAQVAMFSGTREHNVHPEIWTSDVAMINVGIRMPAKYTYTALFAGLHPVGKNEGWTFGMMFGGHLRLPARLFLDIDIGTAVTANGLKFQVPIATLGQLRLLLGWQPFDRLAVFGGPTFNVMGDRIPPETRETKRPGYGWEGAVFHAGGRIRMWPGFAAGVRF